jgi:hypothetical protein
VAKRIKGEDMKNYFNQLELNYHLILMTSMVSADNLIEGNCITDEERKILKKISRLVNEFSTSVFERLGDGYKRSLRNKASLNTIRVVSRNVHHVNNVDMEDFIDAQTLRELVDKSADLDCAGCERTDCLTCAWYKIKSYLNHEGKRDETDMCPFRKEEIKIDDFDFEL